jgi:probable rRNA maturation factor
MGPEGSRDPRRTLRILIGDEQGRRVPSAATLGRWLKTIAPARARGTVSIALVSDARVRALNRRYRGVDRVTDVLSFSAHPGPAAPRHQKRPGSAERRVTALGDIVIARGMARRQAREAGHSEPTEWRVLALHGLLHLLGYDHERDDGRMRRAENRLRRKGGLPGGLIDRAGPA